MPRLARRRYADRVEELWSDDDGFFIVVTGAYTIRVRLRIEVVAACMDAFGL